MYPNPPLAGASTCRFPDSTPNRERGILDIYLGKEKLKSCPFVAAIVGGCTAELDANLWAKFADEFQHGDDPRQVVADLKFARAPDLVNSCTVLHAQGALIVYKDVLVADKRP